MITEEICKYSFFCLVNVVPIGQRLKADLDFWFQWPTTDWASAFYKKLKLWYSYNGTAHFKNVNNCLNTNITLT